MGRAPLGRRAAPLARALARRRRGGLEAAPRRRRRLIVSPSPYGTCADIAGIAEVCHRYGKPLIVDEAWGAHLPFHEPLPTWAMSAGADVCVVSVHKMGLGLEQGSVFHVQGDLVDPSHLSQCADLLMTTSPNVLVYAAMDGWRRHMVREGDRLLGGALDLSTRVRASIERIDGLHVLEEEFLGAEASHDLDRLHAVIDLDGLGVSGYQAADWIRAEHALDVSLSDHRRIGVEISIADDETTTGWLLAALRDLSAHAGDLPAPARIDLPDPGELELDSVCTPREAFFGGTESVPIGEAEGRIAAELATPYPPGIPAFVPGERLTGAVLSYLRSGLEIGMTVPDVTDTSLQTVRVRR
ncbi:aminotransferase class I/II-fold pyridoxal phosphate-dependent enzyme [Rathayibacter sp. VKM Ac-2630]|uniref:aminotransferase class I/II-fold pyridoxal phosphate-dependent enzyme n=1 Tax=Rathayibacter sp. VKM Ac-2630 TaxID=1938617 RepID=UPI00237CE22E|nr:hypothetical protein [Rathayibacter sp. VKM Ac-2630]